jgi:hypothetical protein
VYVKSGCIFAPSETQAQTNTAMKTLANTNENKAFIEAIKVLDKAVGKIYWAGSIKHSNLDAALVSANLEIGINSGWYTPTPIRLNGITGIYMISEKGSLMWEGRIIKESESEFRLEYLTSEGYNRFDEEVRKHL